MNSQNTDLSAQKKTCKLRHKNERIENMKKKKIMKTFICCLCGAFIGTMLYFHRRLIIAAIKGEELPKAPKGCPAYKGD